MLLDLRLLRLALRRVQVADLAASLVPWTRGGLVLMLTTGPLMFASDISRYRANPAFCVKMLVLLLALCTHFTVHRNAVRRAEGRWPAILSLVLWSCVVLGGRAIADFDV